MTSSAPFPPADHATWRALVAKALRVDDPDAALARLRSTTPDGLTIEPLYTAADTHGTTAALPGFGTRRRGRTPAATRVSGWEIRQRVALDDCPTRALEELERGTTGLWLVVPEQAPIDVDVLDAALAEVLVDLVPVTFDAGASGADAGTALLALWERRGIAADDRVGRIGADPFGRWAGDPDVDVDHEFCDAVRLAEQLIAAAPRASTFTIDGTRYHDAGATDADELAFTIAAAVATLRGLEPRLGIAAAANQIELRLAVTADQFGTIAKLRAARVMWARVLDVCGIAISPSLTVAPLHAVMSGAMTTAYDPAVNMLRATVAVFAAGVAGADAITVHPFDRLSASEPTELGRRLARNTQSVLAMESHLTSVIDPAGGSWYVEQLTDALATAAWHRFRELEAAGGFRAAIEAGALELITSAAAQRDAAVARRKLPVTGVSEFPDPNETPPTAAAPSGGAPRLPLRRIADPVERQRRRTDALTAAAGARPRVLLATIGTPADFTARVTFARNYFAAAGIDATTGPVTADPAAIVDAYRAHRHDGGSAVVCVCSNDARYADGGAAVVTALCDPDDADVPLVYLAGRPANLDELTGAGVTAAIALGDDLVATLGALLDHLGAPPPADGGSRAEHDGVNGDAPAAAAADRDGVSTGSENGDAA